MNKLQVEAVCYQLVQKLSDDKVLSNFVREYVVGFDEFEWMGDKLIYQAQAEKICVSLTKMGDDATYLFDKEKEGEIDVTLFMRKLVSVAEKVAKEARRREEEKTEFLRLLERVSNL